MYTDAHTDTYGDSQTFAATDLSPGKYRRLNRLCDDAGRFSMLAIDQRGSLRRMIARHMGAAADAVAEEALRQIKRTVTETIAPLSTAVLTDPVYGYPSSFNVLPPNVGVLLALETTGYEAASDAERLSGLIDGWTADEVLRHGADAVKLLIWHHPEASSDTHAHQQALVQSVGEACASAGLPFVLEIVTYALDADLAENVAHARLKPELVIDGALTYSNPRFGVDLLKLEFPASLKFTEEYCLAGRGTGVAVYGQAEVQHFCRQLDAASALPWVILSAGVDPDEFVDNIQIANAAGASGFLCGRAVWKHVVERFPDTQRMRAYLNDSGRLFFRRIRAANKGAKPWYRHRRFPVLPDS